jgi:cytochrome c
MSNYNLMAFVLVSIFVITTLSGAIAGPIELRGSAPTSSPLVFVADAHKGEGLFQARRSMCHTVSAGGPAKIGPNLHGLYGRKAGSLPGFNYSQATRASGIVWSTETLDAYIANPHQDIPNNRMPFPGMPNKADRDDLLAYLQQATQ